MHRILHAIATERFATLEAAASLEEWLLRPFRRRAAGRALREADVVSRRSDGPHLARVARLLAAGVELDTGFDDVSRVASAYAQLPIPADRRAPIVMLGLLSVVVIVASGVYGWRLATRPFDAVATGSGRAFAERFGTEVASIVNGKRPTSDEAMRRVFPDGLEPPAGDAMKELFAAEVDAANDPSRMPIVFQKTRAVNDAFGKLGQPWYIDARYYRGPLLYAFYREREDEGRADGFLPERIVFGWRLDRLNVSEAALGYTHREAGAALVLYDKVEDFLIRDVLPALVEGEKVDLIDVASRDEKKAWQDDIETRSARMVRESFAGAADRDKLLAVGKLLARRRAIVKGWRADLASQQRILNEPVRLIPEADYAKDLLHRVSTQSRHEWEDIHDELASPSTVATFEALRDRFADDIARHELQHRFDAQRTTACDETSPCANLVVPSAVRTRVGPRDDSPVILGSTAGRVRNETSAYLAQMASGMPKMTLLSLLRTVLDRGAWGDVYCNTTIVLLDVLAAELGLVDEAMPLVVGGAVQRASVASLVTILFAKPDEELRLAAAKRWHQLFGSELPKATLGRVHQAQRWRH